METKPEYDEGGQRSEEAECWVREDSRNLWESPIPLGSQEPSWEKAPVEILNTLQWKHRNAGFGVAKYGSAFPAMNNSRSETLIRVEDAMALLMKVASTENMYAVYKYSHRGAVLAGASAFVGGVLGGPPGIFIGKP
ncbi:hypothetical protein HGM15179_021314 [Zosterops borbonicus]|uniref:Uncharacterized protein n=1 Tax=Zosterops borbonicus TaxID=364589 RepID=A0A8K1D5A6_9PASS|nr:hypothetical protein HGM15179_021314 [Zosterops borbonicus]